MKIVIGGADDRGLARAFDAHDVTHATTAADFESAGIDAADAFVLTDLEQATAIPVAKDRNPELTVLVYADGSLPEFVTRQADKLLDPALFDPDAIADALE